MQRKYKLILDVPPAYHVVSTAAEVEQIILDCGGIVRNVTAYRPRIKYFNTAAMDKATGTTVEITFTAPVDVAAAIMLRCGTMQELRINIIQIKPFTRFF